MNEVTSSLMEHEAVSGLNLVPSLSGGWGGGSGVALISASDWQWLVNMGFSSTPDPVGLMEPGWLVTLESERRIVRSRVF